MSLSRKPQNRLVFFRERGLFVGPERRLDTEFTLRHDDATQIVADKFCQRFVHLGNVRATPHVITELAFDHAEHAFHVF